MNNNFKLPFTINLKGGSKKSFKILNDEQINNKMKKSPTLLNFIKKMIDMNNNSNKSNKIKYVKGSETKNYYKKK